MPIVHKGMHTPWGKADGVTIWNEWAGDVFTSSHGGMHITVAKKSELPQPFQKLGVWFEEDCQWWIPIAFLPGLAEDIVEGNVSNSHFPYLIADDLRVEAVKQVKEWSPYDYEKATGHKVTAEESHVVAEDLWYAEHKDKLLCISAVGISDDDAGVGDGKDRWVKVTACVGGRDRRGHYCGETSEYLVPKDEYHQHQDNFPYWQSFIVDPERHSPCVAPETVVA